MGYMDFGLLRYTLCLASPRLTVALVRKRLRDRVQVQARLVS